MQVKTEVSLDTVASLLTSALEGGSNYWYEITGQHEPLEVKFRTMPEAQVFPHIDYPLNEGGWLTIKSLEEPEKPTKRLNLAACERALQLMADKYPHHWADVLREDADATTGDVFLQLALYGDVLYG